MKFTDVITESPMDIEIYDTSTMINIGRQLAQKAAYESRGENPKESAKAGANRAHSMILMGIDEYFNRQSEKVVK